MKLYDDVGWVEFHTPSWRRRWYLLRYYLAKGYRPWRVKLEEGEG